MSLKIKKNSYGQFLLGSDDVSRRLESNDENYIWDGHIFPYYDKYIKKTDVVLEVGANIGSHSVYLSKLARELIVFEPQIFIFFNLCANLFINDCVNVKAYNLACSDKKEKLYIKDGTPDYLTENTAAGRSFLKESNGDFCIDAVTIDSLKLEKLDFMKTDCEGADLNVLKGAEKTIKKFKPIMVIEIHTGLTHLFGHDMPNYLDFFSKINYDYKKSDVNGDYLLTPK